ncbi:ABC transporter ATP-binding protein [candidate division WOR-3 bacterium]|nr:ABC transporter ATP-binding protein [candidate division WOR-3 bacterium]
MKNFKALKEDLILYKWRILVGFFALLIVDVLQLFIPRIIKYAIDDVIAGGIARSNLIHYALWIIGLAAMIAFFRFSWRYYIAGTARRVEERLRNRLFSHLQILGMRFFKNHKVGDLMAHATNDIDAVRRSLGMGIIGMTDIIVLGTLALVFMLFINVRLTLYAIIPFPLLSFVVLRFARLIHHRFERVQASFSSLTALARENIEGIRIIRAYNQESGAIKKFKEASQKYVNKNMSLVKIWSLFFPLIFLFANLSVCIILWLGGSQVILNTISMGDFVAFQAYLGILIWPMIAIGWVTNLLQRGATSMGRINKILSNTPEIKDKGDKSIKKIKGTLEFVDMSFSYNGSPRPSPRSGTQVLKDINLDVKINETLGIAGMIGSGKSTLVSLIMRLFEPTQGEIRWNNINIKRIPLALLRKSIGFIPQDTFLFSDTIRANIAFGNPDVSDSEIYKAAKMASIYNEIMEFPNQFDELVGERGITLSGGQCQRVAIARAILINPEILILDNAFSSIDVEKEIEILANLRKEFDNRILIIISHRIRSLAELDKIIVLKQGKIVETGTHKELLTNKGTYFNLFKRQELEEKW